MSRRLGGRSNFAFEETKYGSPPPPAQERCDSESTEYCWSCARCLPRSLRIQDTARSNVERTLVRVRCLDSCALPRRLVERSVFFRIMRFGSLLVRGVPEASGMGRALVSLQSYRLRVRRGNVLLVATLALGCRSERGSRRGQNGCLPCLADQGLGCGSPVVP